MAKIELSAEVRAIELLIDTGQQGVAATRLQAAHANIGRRPSTGTSFASTTRSSA
jgi:hypothetical protein